RKKDTRQVTRLAKYIQMSKTHQFKDFKRLKSYTPSLTTNNRRTDLISS
ncbi:MAG: hypothetical protein ACI9YE_003891, partial [Psychroserpens sp.]